MISAFQIRNSCDYDHFYIVSKANAEEQYRKVKEMIDVIIDYLCKSEELYNIFLILCYSS